jgi:glycosyltransferase involved in cell wall biosynthesis
VTGGGVASVSVIVPMFNGARYVREALESIRQQAYSPIEVIVVDDGSTDGGAEIVAAEFPGVRCLRREHAGLSAARNAGLDLAGGTWIGFLDCDDLWAPGKIKKQTEWLASRPDMEALFGHIRQFYTPEDAASLRRSYRYSREVLPGIHPDTILASAAAVRRVGAFNPGVAMGEFLDWFARARDAGLAYGVIPDVLAFRRIHSSNMSITRRKEAAPEYARLLKAALDRRRKNTGPADATDGGPDHLPQEP